MIINFLFEKNCSCCVYAKDVKDGACGQRKSLATERQSEPDGFCSVCFVELYETRKYPVFYCITLRTLRLFPVNGKMKNNISHILLY